MLQPRFTGDLSSLPTHGFGHRALTWWGIMAFFLIEGTFFLLAIAAYFFLMNQEKGARRRKLVRQYFEDARKIRFRNLRIVQSFDYCLNRLKVAFIHFLQNCRASLGD